MGRDTSEDGAKSEGNWSMRSLTRSDGARSWIDATYQHQNQVDGIVDHWGDLMATCYAHLQSALSAIEELSQQVEGSPIDAYCYHEASGCVWVALVALAQCGSDTPAPR